MALEHLKGYAEEGHVDEQESQSVKIPTKVTAGKTAVSDHTIAEYNAAMRHPGGREAFYAEQGAADAAYLDYVTRRQRGAFGSGAGYGGQPSGFFNSGIAPWHLQTAAPSQVGALASAYGSQNARAAAVEAQGLRNQAEMAKLGVLLRGNVRERQQMTDLYAKIKPDLDAIDELREAASRIDRSTEKGKQEFAENRAQTDRLWRKIQNSTPESYEQIHKTAPKIVVINDIAYKQLPSGQLVPIVRPPDTTQTRLNEASTRGSTDATVPVPGARTQSQDFVDGKLVGGAQALPSQSGAAAGAPGAGKAASAASAAPAASTAPAAPPNPMAGTKAGQVAGASSAPAVAPAAPAALPTAQSTNRATAQSPVLHSQAGLGSPNERGKKALEERDTAKKVSKQHTESYNLSADRAEDALVVLRTPDGRAAQEALSKAGGKNFVSNLMSSGVIRVSSDGSGVTISDDGLQNALLAANLTESQRAQASLLVKIYGEQTLAEVKAAIGNTRITDFDIRFSRGLVPKLTDPYGSAVAREYNIREEALYRRNAAQAKLQHLDANKTSTGADFDISSEWRVGGPRSQEQRAISEFLLSQGARLSDKEIQHRIELIKTDYAIKRKGGKP